MEEGVDDSRSFSYPSSFRKKGGGKDDMADEEIRAYEFTRWYADTIDEIVPSAAAAFVTQ